jgi:hypothetical protein
METTPKNELHQKAKLDDFFQHKSFVTNPANHRNKENRNIQITTISQQQPSLLVPSKLW